MISTRQLPLPTISQAIGDDNIIANEGSRRDFRAPVLRMYWEEAQGDNDAERAGVLRQLGDLFFERGDLDRAMAAYNEGKY